MDKRVDLAVAVFIVLLGVFILIAARDIRAGIDPRPDHLTGPAEHHGHIPYHRRDYSGGAAASDTGRSCPATWCRRRVRRTRRDTRPPGSVPSASYLLSMLWEWLLKPLGFLIVTPLYLLVCLMGHGRAVVGEDHRLSRSSSPSSTWVIFGPLLGIRFPLGPLEPLARSLGLIS